ncbi:putative receptor protein kinase ZmPK1 [Acorus calamus]|uniref:Receptor-like serine/threonine-protein kinase n=1 Tax=Acorus calamus TaxID=4465 RepID=A0AAV9F904_ACOCL|nr:putative receptor protein kinase ZmPK1 [Acorus calamus]
MENLILSISLFFLQLSETKTSASGGARGLQSLSKGQYLSVENKDNFLVSPNGTFSSGFYKVGDNAYCFSIWFTNSINKTVVWMANRDHPVNGKSSKLNIRRDGNMILTDADGSIVWQTNTFDQTWLEVQLLELGNLVLANQTGDKIWGSFASPTDSLLPTQYLTKDNRLVSKRTDDTYLSGYYNFHFNDDNVLNLIYNGPQIASVYWPNPYQTIFQNNRTPYNSTRSAVLNKEGHFFSSDILKFNASDYGLGPKRRFTLDYDGILRLYSLDNVTGLWKVVWSPDIDACKVHGLCGSYSVCLYTPSPACSWLPGFERVDKTSWLNGCQLRMPLTCNPDEVTFIQLNHTDYSGYDQKAYGVNITLEGCRSTCLNDCKCKGFGYSTTGDGVCYPKSRLVDGYHMPERPVNFYIKVPKESVPAEDKMQFIPTRLNCTGIPDLSFMSEAGDDNGKTKTPYLKYLIGFVSAVGLVEIICIGIGWLYIILYHQGGEVVDMGYLALAMGFRRFTYTELKTATGNFQEEIGRGGFEIVYKGVLEDDQMVAVKRLEGVSQGEAEFWAEVNIIGKINHMNLVKMLGFCAEKKHRLLVYEYLPKGSLDKILFTDSSEQLQWERRFSIAVGTAKGLSYIHEECLEWVLHCDVKPQNILLDENFQPKLADFGMSKLIDKKGIIPGFSRVRGTRGYLAPEWMMNQGITVKADVYSYGIVLLELLSGRSASGDQDNGHNHLVQWVLEKIEEDKEFVEKLQLEA